MPGVGFSGKDGDVKVGATQAQEARHWTFKPKADNKSYASNKTAGYKRRVAGVKEGTGTVAGAWDAANPITTMMDVGTGLTLLLFLNATINFSVPALIDDLTVNVDIDNGEIVSWDANYGTNGAWTNAPAGMSAEAMTAEPMPPDTAAESVPNKAPGVKVDSGSGQLLTPEMVQAMIDRTVAAVVAAMQDSNARPVKEPVKSELEQLAAEPTTPAAEPTPEPTPEPIKKKRV